MCGLILLGLAVIVWLSLPYKFPNEYKRNEFGMPVKITVSDQVVVQHEQQQRRQAEQRDAAPSTEVEDDSRTERSLTTEVEAAPWTETKPRRLNGAATELSIRTRPLR